MTFILGLVLLLVMIVHHLDAKTRSIRLASLIVLGDTRRGVIQRSYEERCEMSFVLGLILFVVAIGVLDAGLPWPSSSNHAGRP
jgi:hypothetical protein